MKNKELLFSAIDNYALLSRAYRKVLKTLIKLAIDNVVVINIKDLSKLSKVSRPAVYAALKVLEKEKLINRHNNPGSRLSSFLLKPQKFEDIIKYYSIRENILHN
jgi:DNA-binding MarR family transcriptional regulator